jgi:hypothetical protein
MFNKDMCKNATEDAGSPCTALVSESGHHSSQCSHPSNCNHLACTCHWLPQVRTSFLEVSQLSGLSEEEPGLSVGNLLWLHICPGETISRSLAVVL